MPPTRPDLFQYTPTPYLYTPGTYAILPLRLGLGPTRVLRYKPMKDITIAISGMTCSHCLNAVNQALATIPGLEIKSVRIGRVDLRLPDGADPTDRVKAAIEQAGYGVEAVLG